jgi:hypothetical protein
VGARRVDKPLTRPPAASTKVQSSSEYKDGFRSLSAWTRPVRGRSASCFGELDPVAPREPLADHGHRLARTLCGHACVDKECVQRPDPQVVGIPPADLAEEIRRDPARSIAAAPKA